jgi:hypothetical protein
VLEFNGSNLDVDSALQAYVALKEITFVGSRGRIGLFGDASFLNPMEAGRKRFQTGPQHGGSELR